jgi:D-glycero-alpha-D-manno-heptose-7-phosphate kinase
MEGRFTVTAPTRVDLAGGTLDLWPLYCITENAKTINLALDLFAEARFEYVAADKFSLEVRGPSGAQHTLVTPLPVSECRKLDPAIRFPVAVVSAYLATRKDFPTIKITLTWKTSVPMGSGLGGSSTLGVALLRGISRIFGDFTDTGWQWQMLHTIRDIEAAFLEMPTGTQDYLAALFGGLSCFESRAGEIVHTTYRSNVFEALSARTLVLFSGEQHHSGKSNWEVYKGAVEKDRSVTQGLFAIRAIAETLDAELRTTEVDWKKVGQLLTDEWSVRRTLFNVSTPGLDKLLAKLAKKTILGAKVCGAAAGGSLLVLVEPDKREALAAEIEAEGIQVLKTKPVPRGVGIA